MKLDGTLRCALFALIALFGFSAVGKVQEKPALAVRADDWPKLRTRGGEMYLLDASLRGVFAKKHPRALPENGRNLPKATAPAFDWAKLVTPPRIIHQRHPICFAYSAVSALEWNWAVRNGGAAPQLAVQPVLDECGADNGGTGMQALKALLTHGTCAEKDYPFTGTSGKLRDLPLNYRAIAWGVVSAEIGIAKEAAIKRALLEHGPILVSVFVTKPLTQYKAGDIFKEHHQLPPGARTANHNLVIVGWDDNNGKGCWKAQNSWGPNWGDEGFLWIEYGCNYVGLEAYWIRPQSVQYQLPEKANELIPGTTRPFPKWPKAETLVVPAMPLPAPISETAALKKTGQRVVVQFRPQVYGPVAPHGHVLLSSGNPNDKGRIQVWVLKSGLSRFGVNDAEGLWRLYQGKEIRVTGIVSQHPLHTRTIHLIEVDSPDQIKVVKK